MRRKILMLCVVVCGIAITSCNKSKGFTLSGKFTNIKGTGIAVLEKLSTEEIDTVPFVDGQFEINGSVDKPALYKLTLSTDQDSFWFQQKNELLYIENTAIKITGDYNKLYDLDNRNYFSRQRAEIGGGKLNAIYNNYLNKVRPVVKKATEVSNTILLDTIPVENMSDTYFKEMLKKQVTLNKLQYQRDSIKSNFIINNPATQFAYDMVFATLTDDDSYKAVFDESVAHGNLYSKIMEFPEPELVNQWITLLKEQDTFTQEQLNVIDFIWNQKKQIAKGAPFIKAQIRDVKGEFVSLEDQLNKDGYTLIDCWASWCMPCRWFIPHLKQIHQNYKDKGLKIISISIDNYDKEREKKAWYNAMKEEDMPWQQFQANKKSSFVESYGVYSIPNIILIDASHHIVATGVRGLTLDLLLQGIYNE
ncbi:TlpA disulfide reductase family protein [Plebeiibacterium sediminum]|uniref:AhpC/TSA family protein n=1 Tax=Plebeiibacterium sediminum TaxID=2992112 RepID=A0AAE3M7Y9_9BACT|nr:TlpA disulfide reductase family protein [Plebeiobacterium sediminum]MCW3788839.1 AhpC/TSA family protein [Plebeiobacterium sediminum]